MWTETDDAVAAGDCADRMMAQAQALTPDPAAEWAYRRALCAETWDRAWQAAWDAGRRALLEEQAAEQRAVCGPVAALANEPEFAAMEERRYGPGGRGHAADWRPDDYPGGGKVW